MRRHTQRENIRKREVPTTMAGRANINVQVRSNAVRMTSVHIFFSFLGGGHILTVSVQSPMYSHPWSCILEVYVGHASLQVLWNPQQMLTGQGSLSKATSGHGRSRCNMGSWCALGSLLFMCRGCTHEHRDCFLATACKA